MKLSRRDFLRSAAMASAGVAAVACQPQTFVVKETVEVQVEKEVTKIVQEKVEVEKEVTKIIEKEVTPVPTATPVPGKYQESPRTAEMVAEGKLPDVEERLPAEPFVASPTELWGWEGDIGQYGGTWRMVTRGPGDGALWMRCVKSPKMVQWEPDFAKAGITAGYASGWEASDDGRAFTFHLRKGLKWDDGEPFTTGDIQWWYDNYFGHEVLNPGGWSYFRQGEDLAEITVQDDFTWTITFAKPNGFFLWDLCRPGGASFVRPAHIMSQFHADTTEAAELEARIEAAELETWDQLYGLWNSDYSLNELLPGLFPWKLDVPMGAATQVVYERNPYFWMIDTEGQQLPYIRRLRGKVHQTAETMALDAVAGEVDMQTRHISTVDYIPMLQEGAERGDYSMTEFCAATGPSHKPIPLSMTTQDDTKRALFQNKDFRLALSHAIDRENVMSVVFRGAVAFEGPKWDSPLQQDEEDALWEEYAVYDLDLANQMLDDLGLDQRDGDGYRLMENGERLSILCESVTMWKDAVQMLELLVEEWKNVDIEVILKTWDRPLFQEKRDENECELCIHGGPGRGADYTVNLIVDSRYVAPVHWEADWGHEWYEWYNSNGTEGMEPPDEVKRNAELFDQVKTTADFEQMLELYKEMLMNRTKGFWWISMGPYWADPCALGVVKNNMKNVPPAMPNSWWWATPGPSQTWMYYFDPPQDF